MPPEIADVLERLERLERQNERLQRQNRRLKWAGGVGVVLVVAVGLSSCTSQSQGPAVQGTVEAEKFVLKDSTGRVHGTFSASPDGPALLLLDPDDKAKPRAGIVATKDGSTLSMYDLAGKERLRLGWNPPGPGVVLFGEDGKPRVGITATGKGASVELIDGSRRTELSLTPESQQRLAFFDNLSPRLMLTATSTVSGINLVGADKSAVFLENSTEGQRLMFFNAKEVPRIGLGVSPQGPVLKLLDEQGRELFSKP